MGPCKVKDYFVKNKHSKDSNLKPTYGTKTKQN